MWRLNWIHPFNGGNGRTSRALSYLVLCISLNCVLPGEETIPKQIMEDRSAYYQALQEADRAWAKGRLDLSEMESLLSGMLAKQLLAVHTTATRVVAR
jgi:Fic family protein